jgi:hypothetical protein
MILTFRSKDTNMTPKEFNEWFWAAPFCGCCWPGEAAVLVRDVLLAVESDWPERGDLFKQCMPSEGLQHFVLSCLDGWGLIDHGSSLTSGWLTEKGKGMIALIGGAPKEAIDELVEANFHTDGTSSLEYSEHWSNHANP